MRICFPHCLKSSPSVRTVSLSGELVSTATGQASSAGRPVLKAGEMFEEEGAESQACAA